MDFFKKFFKEKVGASFRKQLKNVLGFSPNNASLYKNHERIRHNYGASLQYKGIDAFWNYIDSGTAVKGVINQLNPNQFTLQSYYNGIKHLKLKERIPMLIKNIIFQKGENIVMPSEQFPSNYYSWKRLAEENNGEIKIVSPSS